MSRTAHPCSAPNCGLLIGPDFPLCAIHWRLLPLELREMLTGSAPSEFATSAAEVVLRVKMRPQTEVGAEHAALRDVLERVR